METIKTIDLNRLRDEAYQNAVEHGWHDEVLSTEHFLCLIISELMEAVQAERKGKRVDVAKFNEWQGNNIPFSEETRIRRFQEDFEAYIKDSVEDELADACIRLLDLAGLRNVDLGEVDVDELKCSKGFFDWTFTESIYSIVSDITDEDYIETHSLESYMRVSLREIMSFCVKKGIDISWHIEQKMKYNRTRPRMHGNNKF